MADGPQRAEATELSLPKDTPMEFGPDTPVMHAIASMRAPPRPHRVSQQRNRHLWRSCSPCAASWPSPLGSPWPPFCSS